MKLRFFYFAAAVVAVMVLVCFRSWAFLMHGHALFDSDQAVVGLMARDLAAGTSLPLMFYGARYVLGVESWLVAPFFRLFGESIFALKLPLVLINLITAGIFVRILIRDCAFTFLESLAISSFFLLPGVVTSSRLTEAMGSNPERFLYFMVAWLLRDRSPWILGGFLGFAFLHREEWRNFKAPLLEPAGPRIALWRSRQDLRT